MLDKSFRDINLKNINPWYFCVVWVLPTFHYILLLSTAAQPHFITLPLTLQATEFPPTKKHLSLLYHFDSLFGNILWYMMHCISFLKYDTSGFMLLAGFSLFFSTAACFRFLKLLSQSWKQNCWSLFLQLQCFSTSSKNQWKDSISKNVALIPNTY